jgi:hypothetical protein
MIAKPAPQPDDPANGAPRSLRRRRLVAAAAILVVLSVLSVLTVLTTLSIVRSGPPSPTEGDDAQPAETRSAPAQHSIAAGFPSADTTGVPVGTVLTDYTGPCEISTPGTVIEGKRVDCWPLQIDAPDVVITNSLITGFVYSSDDGRGSFTISDSDVEMGDYPGTGIGDVGFTATRVHVTGGKRSVNCFLDCTVEHSYVHGQFRDDTGYYHESGIRMGSNAVIRGNTVACDAPDVPPDGGCSGALTGYGDFAIVQNNVIDGNLFLGDSGGFCTYGGSTANKPFSEGTRDIRFTNNVWQRGTTGECGVWGPITSFDTAAPGNVWSNNRWEDGDLVAPAN